MQHRGGRPAPPRRTEEGAVPGAHSSGGRRRHCSDSSHRARESLTRPRGWSQKPTRTRASRATPFVVYQGAWSILKRDFEREIIPMACEEGMALAPWNVLAAGRIRTDEEEERRRETGELGRRTASDEWERTPDQRKVCQALEKVAQEVGAPSVTSVAIAYVMQKMPYAFPIVCGHKVEHLMDNIAALDVALSPAQIAYLKDVLPFDSGFPISMIVNGSEFIAVYNASGHFDKWPTQQAIRPAEQ
ncbi:hypothetical protein IEO21_08482 [Rhodonia placenta]|uniref:NADP-dependent oxidoreductase domain-containing protein n=1 Tax=Rhodonia placenta TaxID=104341 RepID=A0A8H7NWF4_9APHY|nr:hypothetical protein IEO21_08482 [Postia placenta]